MKPRKPWKVINELDFLKKNPILYSFLWNQMAVIHKSIAKKNDHHL